MLGQASKSPSLEDMKTLLSERLNIAEKLIKEDVDKGGFNEIDISSFESLHEFTDPNCYVSDEVEPASAMEEVLLKNYETEDWINYWQTLIDALDSWLRCGMEGSAVDHLQDDILIAKF